MQISCQVVSGSPRHPELMMSLRALNQAHNMNFSIALSLNGKLNGIGHQSQWVWAAKSMSLKCFFQDIDNQCVITLDGFRMFDDDFQTREVLCFIFFV